MIREIPFSFKDRNEDYFILGSLQTFCKDHDLKTNADKNGLIDNILEFANENEKNEKVVLEWIDKSLKEGTKKIIISKLLRLNNIMNKNIQEWEKIIKEKLGIESSNYIINGVHSEELKLHGYSFIDNEGVVEKVSLNFTILLKEEKTKGYLRKIIYPIFIDVDIKNKYIIGRAKSKPSISKIILDEEGKEQDLVSTTFEKLIHETFTEVINNLNIAEESKEVREHKFKGAIHLMVDECTKTPDEIVSKTDMEKENIINFVNTFFTNQNINLVADDNYNNAIEDLKVFVEKYISINYSDKDIFTKDRYAYPVQIAATDSDFSSVDESTIDDTPLQCTPIFFDNKKLIQREKKCDNVIFIFKRKQQTYFTSTKFSVILEVKKGHMYADFRKYTLEEDIENVLSRIIGNNK